MAKAKKYKFIGPYLRKLRVEAGIERTWLAKKMSHSTGDIMNMELGVRNITSIRLLKSWLHYIGREDCFPTAVKLYMADGDKLEIDIRALRLEERLRLVAIVSAFRDKQVHPKLMTLIDEALFEKPVTIRKPKHSSGGNLNGSPIMTEFEYQHTTGTVENIQEHFHGNDVKEKGESGGTGGGNDSLHDPRCVDEAITAVCRDQL